MRAVFLLDLSAVCGSPDDSRCNSSRILFVVRRSRPGRFNPWDEGVHCKRRVFFRIVAVCRLVIVSSIEVFKGGVCSMVLCTRVSF